MQLLSDRDYELPPALSGGQKFYMTAPPAKAWGN